MQKKMHCAFPIAFTIIMCLKTGNFLKSAGILIAFQSIELFMLDEIFPVNNRISIDTNLLIRYITKKRMKQYLHFGLLLEARKCFILGR